MPVMMTKTDDDTYLWHQRMGYLNFTSLNKIPNCTEGVKLSQRTEDSICVTCLEGKQTRKPFLTEGSRATSLLELIHSDAEADAIAAYIVNRSPTSTLSNALIYEVWTGKKPNLSHMRIFGCSTMVLISKENKTKLDLKSLKEKKTIYLPLCDEIEEPVERSIDDDINDRRETQAESQSICSSDDDQFEDVNDGTYLPDKTLDSPPGTRPNIIYVVNSLNKYNNQPTNEHWVALKRVMRYQKAWANDIEDRKSSTGFMFFFQGAAISWNSKKQQTIALSTSEAEYMALASAIQEALWLKQLADEFQSELKGENVISVNARLSLIAIFLMRTSVVDLALTPQTLSKPLEERDEFRADVRDIFVKCDRNEKIVILGDFNEKMTKNGEQWFSSRYQEPGVGHESTGLAPYHHGSGTRVWHRAS
ncbi:Retrovirus-related Pol polyprotein from transposon TNT 1-94 [Eumeta japonica]|uniref:Retrovirus-related Pol polyprotein from transposon TNT 1-94 n=1 Tax=Eumeta variegata TaxID=151549 RepID=A0A4C1XC70_EUMVA|nr:Retrovirus-related Pol polyprotein from transposon TNT 1-94 [Eumeta japonica]